MAASPKAADAQQCRAAEDAPVRDSIGSESRPSLAEIPSAGLPTPTREAPCRRGRSATPDRKGNESMSSPLVLDQQPLETPVAASPSEVVEAAAAVAAVPPAGVASGVAKKELQPSMQAWIASRHGRVPNIGKSENAEGSAMYSKGSASSQSKREMSTDDLEALHAEEARRDLHEQIKRNAKSAHNAINFPDTEAGAGATRRSTSAAITVPHEFHLSSSNYRSHSREVSTERSERKKMDWQHSLRGEEAVDTELSTSRSRSALRLHLTVAEGPNLRTATRARSRSVGSRGSSVCGTPDRSCQGTPRRGRSVTNSVTTPLPLREQSAVEHFLERMAGARTPSASPARGRRTSRNASPSPARENRSASRYSATPTRNGKRSAPSTPGSVRSTSSQSHIDRMSQLSQRTPGHNGLSSAQLLEQRVEQKRRELHEQRLKNERNYKDAIANPDMGKNGPKCKLTVPHAPNLSTSSRARSRSTCRSRSATPDCSVERRSAFSKADRRTERVAAAPSPPSDQSAEEWIQAGATPQERAERAKISAQAKVERESEDACALLRKPIASFNTVVPAKEQAAIKEHVDLVDASGEQLQTASNTTAEKPPADGNVDEWVEQGATAQDRAERAKVAAQAKVDQEMEKKKALFQGAKTSGEPRSKSNRPVFKPRCVFTPASSVGEAETVAAETASVPEAAAETGSTDESQAPATPTEETADQKEDECKENDGENDGNIRQPAAPDTKKEPLKVKGQTPTMTRSASGGPKATLTGTRYGVRSPRVAGRSPPPAAGSKLAATKPLGNSTATAAPMRPTTPGRRAATPAVAPAAASGGYGFGSRSSRPCLR